MILSNFERSVQLLDTSSGPISWKIQHISHSKQNNNRLNYCFYCCCVQTEVFFVVLLRKILQTKVMSWKLYKDWDIVTMEDY